MMKIKFSLIYFILLSYACSTNSQTNIESNSLEYTKNDYHLDLTNLSPINSFIDSNIIDCYIVAIDSSSHKLLLKLNLNDHRIFKMDVLSFDERLIAIDYIGTKDSYVREERVFVFGDQRGVLKYDFIVDGDIVRFLGFSIFKQSVEKNYLFIEPNSILESSNYLDSIINCSPSLLIEQDHDFSEFKYSISNGQLLITSLAFVDSKNNFKFNCDRLQNCVDFNYNLMVSVFCIR